MPRHVCVGGCVGVKVVRVQLGAVQRWCKDEGKNQAEQQASFLRCSVCSRTLAHSPVLNTSAVSQKQKAKPGPEMGNFWADSSPLPCQSAVICSPVLTQQWLLSRLWFSVAPGELPSSQL